MAKSFSQRAPFNDWWYWSECLVKRLRTMTELYKENGEPERSGVAAEWAKKLKDNCMVPVMAARKGMKTDEEKAELRKLEEVAILKAAQMFRELLMNLPFMSSAIQDFLNVNWQDCKWDDPEEEEIDEYTGLPVKKKKKRTSGDTRISELFWGPKARQDEGIRSGRPVDGGLPGILMNLLAAEKSTSSRAPTDYGQSMLAAAAQTGLAKTMAQAEKLGMTNVNFKPGGGF
jgi:SpoVK/Ycf46/Vps4 family AAA+-type ATPase